MSGTTEVQAARWQAVVAASLGLLVVVAVALALGLVAADDSEYETPSPVAATPYRITYERKEASRDEPRVRDLAWQDERHLRFTETVEGRVVQEQVLDGENWNRRSSETGPWMSNPLSEAIPATPSIRKDMLLAGLTGIRIGSSIEETLADFAGREPDGREPEIVGRGRVLGRPCYVIEGGPVALTGTSGQPVPTATYRAWVDMETLVVLRWETTFDGRVVVESIATSFEPGATFAADEFARPH